MYNGEDIKLQREAIANQIVKGFSNSDDLLEKAHNHGDIHPNGKWYWESSANGGKGDWRTIKASKTATTKQKSEKKEDTKQAASSEDGIKPFSLPKTPDSIKTGVYDLGNGFTLSLKKSTTDKGYYEGEVLRNGKADYVGSYHYNNAAPKETLRWLQRWSEMAKEYGESASSKNKGTNANKPTASSAKTDTTKKLTPVQQKVMKRFEDGEKLVILKTNRKSGDAIFWCEKDEKSGLWLATEKALYPQLRRLFWDKLITDDMFVDASQIDKEYNQDELHAEGAIGF